ncbi:MAG: hypothetical protein KGL52_09110 [Rhodospirillales bacterium]|nr:hypothetical protein [Rhodospirillales bacterium]
MSAAAPSLPATAPWALAERFAGFIAGLRDAMGIDAGHNAALMNIAARLWNRLTEAAERFAAIAAKPAARSRRPAPEAEPAHEPAQFPENAPLSRPFAPRRTLPRGHGWLVRMAPQTVPLAVQFAYLLAQPEMTELLTAAPRLWRVLRPLCRMLGITPHDAPPPPEPAPAQRAAAADIARARRRRRAQLRLAERAAIRRHGPKDDRPPLFRF